MPVRVRTRRSGNVIMPRQLCTGMPNYSATSNNMKLVHWPLIGDGVLHLVHRGGNWVGPQPAPRPLFTVPNVTLHQSTASVPITVLLSVARVLMGNKTFRYFASSPPERFATTLDGSLYLDGSLPGRFATWTFRTFGRFATSLDVSGFVTGRQRQRRQFNPP